MRLCRCVDEKGDKLNYTEINNKSVCLDIGPALNYSWQVPDISFDNVLIGYLALLQIVRSQLFVLIYPFMLIYPLTEKVKVKLGYIIVRSKA